MRGYLAAVDAPDELISASRAVVFRGSRVIVVDEADGARHVMPGGRREAGESLEATARRELLEECGWHVGELKPFAFLHFHHPGPDRPADWRDTINVVHLAEALRHDRGARDPSQGKVRARLMSVTAALGVLADRHQAMLRAALAARAGT